MPVAAFYVYILSGQPLLVSFYIMLVHKWIDGLHIYMHMHVYTLSRPQYLMYVF